MSPSFLYSESSTQCPTFSKKKYAPNKFTSGNGPVSVKNKNMLPSPDKSPEKGVQGEEKKILPPVFKL